MGFQDVFAAERASRQQQAQYGAEQTGLSGLNDLITKSLESQQGIVGPASGYQKMVSDYSGAANDPYWTKDQDKYQFETDVSKYLDPSLNYRIQQGTRGLDASAAAQGGLYSSGHGTAVNAAAQGLASTEYANAFGRMQDVNKQGYQQYSDLMNNLLQRQTQRSNILGNTAQIGMQGLNMSSNVQGSADTARMNAMIKNADISGKLGASKIGPGASEYWGAGLDSLIDVGGKGAAAYLGKPG